MTTVDPGSLRQADLNLNEPENPLRHYAGILRRRARMCIIALVVGLILGLIASFFIKTPKVSTHYYKAITTLAATSGSTTAGSSGQGYSLERAVGLLQDHDLLAKVAKKVHWSPVKTGNHLSAQAQGDQYAIDVVGIAEHPKTAETLADTAAATLATMADKASTVSFRTSFASLTQQRDHYQAQLDKLDPHDPTQATQYSILQSRLSSIDSQLAALSDNSQKLGLTTAREAHAIEINKEAYHQRLTNAINLPGQLQQPNNAPVNSSDKTIDETDLHRTTVPGRTEQILIGGAVGLVVGIILSFIVEAWDDKVRSRARAESLCDLPVLAEIPSLTPDEAATNMVGMIDSPKSPTAERFRATCTAALFALGESATERPNASINGDGADGSTKAHTSVILVTSPGPGEGKTTTSANLAAAFADTGRRVLTVDGDFRRPALAKYLVPVASLTDPHGPAATRVENVSFLAAPHDSDAAGDIVFELRRLVARYKNDYDIVVIDTPPMLTTNDATDLLAAADATLLVVRAGRTRATAAQRAATVLSRLRADVLGIVLNGCDRKEMENYYGYGYGYNYYYYGKDANEKKRRKRNATAKRSSPAEEFTVEEDRSLSHH